MMRAFQIAAAVLILALVVGLYRAKTDAGAARARVRDLQGDISETQADIRELRAEIAHLESPGRVEALAKQELKREPGREGRILKEDQLDEVLPPPRASETK